MNTLNFTFNFNAPVGQNIAHVDKLEAHFDKDMTMQVVDTAAVCREAAKSDPRLRFEDLARAIEGVQSFFWAQSAWAVVYCVCRDHLEMTDNMSEFERMVEGLPFTKRVVECPEGTVRKAVMRNEFMNYPLHRWPEGRASKLAEKLVEKLDGEAP
jgi:G3E family GTPase